MDNAEDDGDDGETMFEQTIKIIRKLEKQKSDLNINKKMSSRFSELGKFYLEKGMEINFHNGFRDLNPGYHN